MGQINVTLTIGPITGNNLPAPAKIQCWVQDSGNNIIASHDLAPDAVGDVFPGLDPGTYLVQAKSLDANGNILGFVHGANATISSTLNTINVVTGIAAQGMS